MRKLCEKALKRILSELFHKASHGSLPWHVFYLTYLRTGVEWFGGTGVGWFGGTDVG